MDQALHAPDGGEEQRFQEAAQVLAASRELGWGGVTLLWHPAAFGSGWLSPEIGKVFWRLAADRLCQNDQWMPSLRFLELARERFVQAGLLSNTAQTRVIEMSLQEASHQAAADVTA